jgi:hypothetical protein
MGFHFSGDMTPISQIVDDGAGHCSFKIDVNFDDTEATVHDGTICCDGPVKIVSEQHMDGAGQYFSQTNGNIYQWEVRCAVTAGAHWVIQLAELPPSQDATNHCAQCGAPVGTSSGASLPKAASDSAVTASGGEDTSATTDSPEG